MKKIFSGITVAFLVVLMVSSFAFARGQGDNNYGRQLTGKTVDLSGTIQAVDFTPPHRLKSKLMWMVKSLKLS